MGAARLSWARRHGVTLTLALLAGGTLLALRHDRRPAPPPPAPPPLLSGGEDGRLVFSRARAGSPRESLSLRRYQTARGAEWWLDAPHLRADDQRAEELWRLLTQAPSPPPRVLPGPGYGISGESSRIVVRVGGHALFLGDDSATGEVYGARDSSPDILVLPGRLRELLLLPREALTRTELTLQPLDPDDPHLQQVAIGALTLTRRPSSWLVREDAPRGDAALWLAHEDDAPRRLPPAQDHPPSRARQDKVTELLRALATARATRVLGGNGIPFRLTDPRIRPAPLALRVNGAEQLFFGLPCPRDPPRTVGAVADLKEDAGVPGQRLVVRSDGASLCFAAADLAPLLRGYDELREPRLCPFASDEIVELRLQHGGAALTFSRSGGTWTTADAASVEQAAVDAFLDQLLVLRGEPSPSAPAPAPALAVAIKTRAGDELRLRLQGDAAVRDDEPPLRVAGLKLVQETAERLFWRPLLRLPPYDVTLLRRTRGPLREELRASGAGPLAERLRLVQPVAAPVDGDGVARALGVLADLRVSPADTAPATPTTLEVVAGPLRAEVQVAAPDPSGCLIAVTRGPAPTQRGRLDPAACEELLSPWPSRALLLVDEARLQRIEVQGAVSQHLRREGARWYAGEAPLAEPARAALFDALHGLARGAYAGYDLPTSPSWLRLRLRHAPLPVASGLARAADVPPDEQELLLYPPTGATAVLAGRAVRYALPALAVRALLAALRPPGPPKP